MRPCLGCLALGALVGCSDAPRLQSPRDAAVTPSDLGEDVYSVHIAQHPGPRACDEAASRGEGRGCAFVATSLLHHGLGQMVDGQRPDDFHFAVAVANPWDDPVTVTVEGLGETVTETLAPRRVSTLARRWFEPAARVYDPAPPADVQAADGVVRLTASAPVSAWQLSPWRAERPDEACAGRLPEACLAGSAEASRLVPVHQLGTRYVALTLPTQRVLSAGETAWRVAAGAVTIVALGGGATVRLSGSGESTAALRGPSPRAVRSLGPFEILSLVSSQSEGCAREVEVRQSGGRFCVPLRGEDLSGTVIESDRPVAVFAGHACAQVPFDRYACDHVEEQLPPVAAWGTEHVVARAVPLASGASGTPAEGPPTYLRVIADADTTLSFEPAGSNPAQRIAAHEPFEMSFRAPFVLRSQSPVMVASFRAGSAWWPASGAAPLGELGDPWMVIETPRAQWRRQYVVTVPEATRTAWATVIGASPPVVDDRPFALAPAATLGDLSVWNIPLSQGFHEIRGPHRMGLRLDALGRYVGYGVSGEGDLNLGGSPE